MEGHAKISPISRLPLITVLDNKHHLKDFPVYEPFHLELNFFSKANRVLHYPVRAYYMDGLNLMAHNLSSGSDTIYRKLYTSIPGNVEYRAKYLIHSKKQRLFLVVYEFSGATNEVVLYWENSDAQVANSKSSTVKGRDAAFVGPHENQFAILDDDKTVLGVYTLPGGASQEAKDNENVFEENPTATATAETTVGSIRGPTPYMFETEVDRIFSTPLDSSLMFATHGNQIGIAKLLQGYRLSTSTANGQYLSTNSEGKKSIKLKRNEIVLQIHCWDNYICHTSAGGPKCEGECWKVTLTAVTSTVGATSLWTTLIGVSIGVVHWQETLRGYVAGILTTERVLIVSAALDILAATSANFDKGLPPISFILISLQHEQTIYLLKGIGGNIASSLLKGRISWNLFFPASASY
ncbi:hypothetical protein V8G54_004312 [Vigna mungo]|uniref:Uncharacterized protein n=1 Tax=Vigna mungo TaxID=3915 RepID=A0AAQ3PCE6_VIGMU